MKTTDRVFELTRDTVSQLGYELVEVEFFKDAPGWVLILYIDAPDGITLDDCEKVSRAIDPILEEADPIEQSYYLSVSSLGLDRPIKKDRDFERNHGKKITVKLYAPVAGKKEFEGELAEFDGETFSILLMGGETMTFARKDAAMIKPLISFDFK